jgi:invasion protein IalB
MRIALLILMLFFLSACVSNQQKQITSEQTEADSLFVNSLQWTRKLEQEKRVDYNWSVDCTIDKLTTLKRCFAFTFGQKMSSDRRVYGGKDIPFQVYFIGTSGPFVMAGFNTYPGKSPTVRVDDNDPVRVHDYSGVSKLEPDESLVELLRKGKVARISYHIWPEGRQDMIVDLTGFEEAWQRLMEKKQ